MGVDRELPGLLFGGMRGVVGVVALAAGLVLAVTVMPGCGSGCPTPDQRTYLEEVEDWAERSEAANRDLQTVVTELGSRPEAFIDEEWRRRLKRTLDELNSDYEAIIDVEVPAGAEALHGTLVRTLQGYIKANELLWRGVLDVDAKTIDRSNETRGEANRLLFEELLPTAERFCE